MDLMQVRHRMMTQTKKSRLPNEYQEVEYLEGTGKQRIDTDIYTSLSDNTEYDAVVGYWTPSKTRQLMGADYGAYFGVSQYNHYEIGADSKIIPSTSEYDVIHFQQDIANRRQILTVNGTKFIRNNFTNWKANLISIFGLTAGQIELGTYVFECNCRLKMFRITRNQTILGDFVPCYRKSDGEIGMYDTVSKTFYTNGGTGTFLKGADV